MKKSIIFLFIIAVLIMPFKVLAEGEDDVQSPENPSVKEKLEAKYKEFLLYLCKEESTDGDSTTSSNTDSFCSMINAENFDWNTLITDGILYFPMDETNKTPIKYSINENEENIHFTVEVNVHNGMTYEETSDEVAKSICSMFMLPVVAMMNGATAEEGLDYLLKAMMSMMFSSISTGANSSVIILPDDDGNSSVTYDPGDNTNVLIIRESEFPNRVIEYLENVYKEPVYGNGLYFLYGISMEKIDNDNAKVSSTYSINYNMNLEVLREYIASSDEEEEEEEEEKEKTEETERIIDDDVSKNSIDPTSGKDTGTVPNPDTSTLMALIIVPILTIAGYVLYSFKYKKKISKI